MDLTLDLFDLVEAYIVRPSPVYHVGLLFICSVSLWLAFRPFSYCLTVSLILFLFVPSKWSLVFHLSLINSHTEMPIKYASFLMNTMTLAAFRGRCSRLIVQHEAPKSMSRCGSILDPVVPFLLPIWIWTDIRIVGVAILVVVFLVY